MPKTTRTPKVPAAAVAVEALEAAGWLRDGETPTEAVRMGTSRSPVYGGLGGEARVFGGRARFRLPGTDRKVTVGKQSVCFYRVADGKTSDFQTYSTGRDIDDIRQAALAAGSPAEGAPAEGAGGGPDPADARAARMDGENAAREPDATTRDSRILRMSGTKGRLFERADGCFEVDLHADGTDPARTEVVCCRARGVWLVANLIRNVRSGHPDEHSAGCVGVAPVGA